MPGLARGTAASAVLSLATAYRWRHPVTADQARRMRSALAVQAGFARILREVFRYSESRTKAVELAARYFIDVLLNASPGRCYVHITAEMVVKFCPSGQ